MKKQHYNLANVRASLTHFLIGKSLTAVSSITALLLVARALPVPQFAAYAVFQAVVNLIGLLTTFGVGQTVVRYVPELRAANNNLPMYRLISRGIVTRGAAIGIALALAWLSMTWWAPLVNLEDWLPWLAGYLLVGWFRLMNMFVSRALESLLWQKLTQYSLASGSMLRLMSVSWLAWNHLLTLENVILMELASEGLSFSLMLIGYLKRWRADPHRGVGDVDWATHNRSRLRRFGLWGYLQSLATLLYGGAPNRVTASALLGAADVGLFAFVDNLGDYGQKFLPTRMLHGIIRPVFFARYSQTGDFGELGSFANLTFRISLLALGLPAVVLIAVGYPLLDWLTAGKYGEAAYLVSGFMLVLAVESLRSQLELLTQAIERNEIFLFSNLALSSSILFAVALLNWLGLWAFVLGGLLGNLLSLLVIQIWLRKIGLRFHLDLWMTFKSILGVLLSGGLGLLLSNTVSPVLGGVMGVSFFVVFSWVFPSFRETEKALISSALRGRRP